MHLRHHPHRLGPALPLAVEPSQPLTEEHYWRVRTARHPGRATALGWSSPPQDAPELRPTAVAALYRQLCKSLGDGKNEPDAADFYEVVRDWGRGGIERCGLGAVSLYTCSQRAG